jgi:hypothetical protein
MARDRSLDEFLGGASGGDDGSNSDGDEPGEGAEDADEADDPSPGETGADGGAPDGDAEGNDEDATDEEVAALAPRTEPPAIEVTMAFAVGGAACAACGETVRRRWQGEAGLVCPDCKEW